MKKPTGGRCTGCGRYRPLNDAGLIRLHKRDGVVCPGSVQPPKVPARMAPKEDPAARLPSLTLRRRVLERDGYACRKCGTSSPDGTGLEMNHVTPYADGGLTVAENLHTLCAMCHAELSWLWSGAPPVSYDEWLRMTPVVLVVRTLLFLCGDAPHRGIAPEALARELDITREAAAKLIWSRRE